MELNEFREDFINDINIQSVEDGEYAVDIFIDECKDILINDFGVLSDLNKTYKEYKSENNQFRSMRIDASYLEPSINTIHLLYADFNAGEIETINNEFINQKTRLMLNFVYNIAKGYFLKSSESDETTQLANDFLKEIDVIDKIHLIIISTNIKSKRMKTTFSIEPFEVGKKKFNVDLTLLDIEAIYSTKLVNFRRDDIIIDVEDYGISGIPCLKANINSDDYDSYLAVVPGKFLADIYLKYSARLLEGNVRSFLNTRGEINKGILNTILYEKPRFFAYNNGISTIAEEIKVENTNNGLEIKQFKNLQIINGGQTTASLASAVIKNNADLDGIFVQMKLSLIDNPEDDSEMIRLISKYANKQNKVTNADLNSNHPFYTRIEDLSRRVKAPLQPNSTIQYSWFFERSRGQYDQGKMQLKTKKERDMYELKNPKSKKFTKTDLAKYINASEMKPYNVSWGAEVNLTRFQVELEKAWDKSNSSFNELYYKDLIAKAIVYKEIEKIISNADWYQERKGYRAQLVPYTFSKFVYEVKNVGKVINYKKIWEQQSCLTEYKEDLENIAKIVFDVFYDPNRQIANISEYAKREICWKKLNEKSYKLSEKTISQLVDEDDIKIEQEIARKDQKFTNDISKEVEIFKLGVSYWENIKNKGIELNELTENDLKMIDIAIKYVRQVYPTLSKKQVKNIWDIKERMDKYI